MDPLTLALTLANTALTFAMRIYEDTPVAIRQNNAEIREKLLQNIGEFLLGIQGKINAAVK